MLRNWENWRTQNLTQHRNWRPDLYRAACQHWGVEPDPAVLAYNTSYEKVRADLKELPSSAYLHSGKTIHCVADWRQGKLDTGGPV